MKKIDFKTFAVSGFALGMLFAAPSLSAAAVIEDEDVGYFLAAGCGGGTGGKAGCSHSQVSYTPANPATNTPAQPVTPVTPTDATDATRNVVPAPRANGGSCGGRVVLNDNGEVEEARRHSLV